MRRMVTRDELAALLADVNVEELARASGVATKTIYRLRHTANSPNLETVEKLLSGMRKIRAVRPDLAVEKTPA